MDVAGASKIWVDIDAKYIEVEVAGASELTLLGSAKDLEADLVGASELNAFNLEAEDVDIDVVGASSAKVYASEELRASATGASKIRYRGDARVSSTSAGLSSVKKD